MSDTEENQDRSEEELKAMIARYFALAKIHADAMHAARALPISARWQIVARVFVALAQVKIARLFGRHEEIARHQGTITGLVSRMEE